MLRKRLLNLINVLLYVLIPSHGGYTETAFQLVLDSAHTNFDAQSFHKLSMLDFGSNEIHNYCQMSEDNCVYEYLLATDGTNSSVFKEYGYRPLSWAVGDFFKHLGMKYVSIDINGRLDSVIADLRDDLSLNESFKDWKFDIVSNIGCSEHVGEGDTEERLL